MFPELPVPSPLIGLILLAIGALWIRHWRRKEDPDERKAWQFGIVLVVAGVIGLTNILGTIHWGTYGFMTMLGCLAVTVFGVRWTLEQRLLSMENTLELLIITGICGLVGARVVFLFEQWDVHFADRPPILRVGTLPDDAPFAPGDELRLLVHGVDQVAVTFRGDERTLAQVKERIDEQAGPHDVTAKILTTQHRGDHGLAQTERGLLLETGRRGPGAQLKIDPSCAFYQRMKPVSGVTDGMKVPWTKIFDLRMGGQTYFGAVFGILLAGFIYLRVKKVSFLAMLDVMAPVLPLGLFFGRMGCLGYGCCWGRELPEGSVIPGLRFPRWSPAWRQMLDEHVGCNYDPLVTKIAETKGQLPPDLEAALGPIAKCTPALHPAQLYEGIAVLFVAVGIYFYREKLRTKVGQAFALLVLLQAPIRFVVEHLRRDHDVFWQVGGYLLTESQTVAIVMVVGAIAALVWLKKYGQPVATLESASEPEPEPADVAGEDGSLDREAGIEERVVLPSASGRASPEPERGNLGAEPPGNQTEART